MARRDPLAAYNAKRDFARTPEPAGTDGPASGNLFVVQKHDATRLHWDFRLEAGGTLKSWAVTRGPSRDPADRRLAVRTEDHPLSYAAFEGSIPEGEYGGGTVMLWDRGTWEPVAGKSAADIDDGHLHFRLYGERMRGDWLLVKMKPRKGEKRENWLLRKIEDAEAGAGDDLVERYLTSVATGRTMAEIADDPGGQQSLEGKSGKSFATAMAKAERHVRTKARSETSGRKAARPKKTRKARIAPPPFQAVQLATLVDAVPAGSGWMHEIKFDGYRALASVAGPDVRIYTRSGLDWTDQFRAIADALVALDLPPALIDGEVVVLDQDGNPSFSALQATLKEEVTVALSYFAFDLLSLDGEDLTTLPAIARKERLETLLRGAPAPIHVADHVVGTGQKLFEAMCGARQEGIVSKRTDGPYRGGRTRSWVKVKCALRQEFVIVGWIPSTARARPFASLLLALREGEALVYKGKVGTGFDGPTMADLAERMADLAGKVPAVDVPRSEARDARWIEPELVAEVVFAQFTTDGRIRHGSFIGLRMDKPAPDVVPEQALPVKEAGKDGANPTGNVKITHGERVIFPESGRTKGNLATYYLAVGPLMLPFLAGRPLSLVRCPQGRARQCFFQKHDSGTFGPEVLHVPIVEKDGASEDYLYVSDMAGIIRCVQMGTIEFHGWGAPTTDVEYPDRMIFDLDPDEGLDFEQVKCAAREIRGHLADIGLVSFAMVSGGKGVHVVVPLTPGHSWDVHKEFARRFAEAMSLAEPDRFVATMSKARRKGRIFIDWLRNQRGSTAVLPYSARARPNAPVAVPVEWHELDGLTDAHPFTIDDSQILLARAGSNALQGWGFARQTLPDI
jgi:bifunctional non-homologous end joining protein LigD